MDKKIYVIGDIMLDKWMCGINKRKNPESRAPLIDIKNISYNLGGASNVAVNISQFDIPVILIGSIGNDESGVKILDLISKAKFESSLFQSKHTIQKTRIVDELSRKHLIRYDYDYKFRIQNTYNKILEKIKPNDIVVISDYGKGIISSTIIKKIIQRSKNILVDPKQKPYIYKNCYLVKPNMKKFLEWTNSKKFTWKNAMLLLKKMNWKWLIITDGPNGVYVLNETKKKFFRSKQVKAIDVSGSGDIVLSYLAYCFYTNKELFFSIYKSSIIATYYVQEAGVSIINKSIIKNFTEIVFTNGCFDILHDGHIRLLKFAKTLGDKLVIGLNSDMSVKKNKGDSRPINSQEIRKRNLKRLNLADEIIIFNEKTPLNLIKKIKPSTIVKGSDYKKSTVVGNKLAKIEIFPKYKNFSTTKIINKNF